MFTSLPSEILVDIFLYLADDPIDLVLTSRCCRLFHRALHPAKLVIQYFAGKRLHKDGVDINAERSPEFLAYFTDRRDDLRRNRELMRSSICSRVFGKRIATKALERATLCRDDAREYVLAERFLSSWIVDHLELGNYARGLPRLPLPILPDFPFITGVRLVPEFVVRKTNPDGDMEHVVVSLEVSAVDTTVGRFIVVNSTGQYWRIQEETPDEPFPYIVRQLADVRGYEHWLRQPHGRYLSLLKVRPHQRFAYPLQIHPRILGHSTSAEYGCARRTIERYTIPIVTPATPDASGSPTGTLPINFPGSSPSTSTLPTAYIMQKRTVAVSDVEVLE
ncbi:hypothetical protein M427DRAFT_66274, partial [Gonapodya prolifera JEL478]